MKSKSATSVRKVRRVTIAVLRGMPSYKEELKQKVENIRKNQNKSVSLERLIEYGISLALEEYGESPPTGRLQGRYAEKS